jgi:hypothetical protein
VFAGSFKIGPALLMGYIRSNHSRSSNRMPHIVQNEAFLGFSSC